MTDYIATPTIGEILLEEFMEPMSISAYKLAQEIHVPVSRIQDILHDRRKITADTSLRLAKFFWVSDKYFLDMQNDIDIRNLKVSLADDIAQIRVCQKIILLNLLCKDGITGLGSIGTQWKEPLDQKVISFWGSQSDF